MNGLQKTFRSNPNRIKQRCNLLSVIKKGQKTPHGKGENALPSRQNGRPSGESNQAITDNTNNTTNKNPISQHAAMILMTILKHHQKGVVTGNDTAYRRCFELEKGLTSQQTLSGHAANDSPFEASRCDPSNYSKLPTILLCIRHRSAVSGMEDYLAKVAEGLLDQTVKKLAVLSPANPHRLRKKIIFMTPFMKVIFENARSLIEGKK